MFKRFKKPAITPEMTQGQEKSPSLPDGEICISCPSCKKTVFCKDVAQNLGVCPRCGFYNRISARERIKMLADEGSFNELFTDLKTRNIIDFPEYDQKIQKAEKSSGEAESVICAVASVDGQPLALFVMEAGFMMGSMGAVTGEKITLLFEYATKNRLPVVGFTVSGGARMQEGIISLMQMAKTGAAVKKHSESGGLYITVLTDPTTGGVTASFAMLGDIILAEPNALIGFAGPRVIEQTIRQKLPQGFQRAEFLLEKGFVDKVVARCDQRATISLILRMSYNNLIQNSNRNIQDNEINIQNSAETGTLNNETNKAYNSEADSEFIPEDGSKTDFKIDSKTDSKANSKANSAVDSLGEKVKPLSPYEKVLLARKAKRTGGQDFIGGVFDGFIEFHGDRRFGDDKAIICGMAWLGGRAVTVIAQEKGRDTKEKLSRNFGCAHPEGYRKALRHMKLAEKFNRPVVCFIDTSGAYCGIGAEERGQGGAIAENLAEMSALKTPIISVLIGEGGSGGALALAVADSVWMLENAVYSVISPEGCASILWKDDKRAAEAAERLKMTADDLIDLKVVDKILPECEDKATLFALFRQEIASEITRLQALSAEDLVKNRYNRFRKFGR